MAKAKRDEDPGVTRVARAYAALADAAAETAPRRANGGGHDIDLRDHAPPDGNGHPPTPDAGLAVELAALRARVDRLAQRVALTAESDGGERPWERSLNHVTAVLVGQRNDHAGLRAMVEELTTLVTQEHEAIEAARAERANQRAGDLARHAALLDQLASALGQVDDLAAKVKRQQGQITRLRAEMKKLKSADG